MQSDLGLQRLSNTACVLLFLSDMRFFILKYLKCIYTVNDLLYNILVE